MDLIKAEDRYRDNRRHKTIYFLENTVPTPEQKAEAEAIGGFVVFRNASMITADGPIEHAHAVAGLVPARYREAYESKGEVDRLREGKAEFEKRNRLLTDFDRGTPRADSEGRNPNLPAEMPTTDGWSSSTPKADAPAEGIKKGKRG